MASDASVSRNTKALEDLRRSLDRGVRALEHYTAVFIEDARNRKDGTTYVQHVHAPEGLSPEAIYRETKNLIGTAGDAIDGGDRGSGPIEPR